MIYFKDILEQLSHVEFSIIEEGALTEEKQFRKIQQKIALSNLGILDLHKKFELKKYTLEIQCEAGKSKYTLSSGYKYITYIDDHSEQEVLEIRSVVDTVNGLTLALNINNLEGYVIDNSDFTYVNTPLKDVIEVPCEYNGILRVVYKPMPVKIPTSILKYNNDKTLIDSIEKYVVDLPEIYLQALIYYMSARLFTTKQGENDQTSLGFIYSRKYKEECNYLQQQGYDVKTNRRGTNLFLSRGFI